MNIANNPSLNTTEGPSPIRFAYSKKEAAQLLSLSLRTVEYLIANGILRVKKCGKRVLIPHQVLCDFIRHDHPSGRRQQLN